LLVDGPTSGDTTEVLLVLIVVLTALALGRLAGGTPARLASLPLHRRRLVVLALVAQLLGAVVGGPAYTLGLGASAVLVVVFLAGNRGLPGTGLIALGLLANALVVGANGAMPVSAEAAGRAGTGTGALVAGTDPRHELAGRQTRLAWLADVVPVPLPRFPLVVSPGDVLAAAGAGQLVVAGMLRQRPAPRLPVVTRVGAESGAGRQRRVLPPP